MSVRRAVSALAGLALLEACARNPVSGRPELTVMSAAEERRIGAEQAAEVSRTIGLVDDPGLATYVKSVGARLADRSPRRDVTYTFAVVDMAEPNAFSLPGGEIFVSRGLLVLANSEDELAGVLGHEIGHVAARHAARRVTRAAPLALVTALGAGLTGLVSPAIGGLLGGVGGLANSALLAPYSRNQEREADRVGQEIIADAGYDPAALSTFLHTLEREEALHRDQARAWSFFATHPPTPERVATTAREAAQMTRSDSAPIAASDVDFLAHLDGLSVGPSARDGVFEGATFRHPDLDFTIQLPAGWKTANGRSAIGAVAPDGAAIVLLDSTTGTDVVEAERAFEKEAGSGPLPDTEKLAIAGLPAIHAAAVGDSRRGPVALDLTWIAYAGRVYRVIGIAPGARAEAFRGAWRETAASFRPLTASERRAMRETRLRPVRARRGETIGDLVGRTGSTWTAEEAAVANEIAPGDVLAAGRPVKVVVIEPYAHQTEEGRTDRGRRGSPSADSGGFHGRVDPRPRHASPDRRGSEPRPGTPGARPRRPSSATCQGK